MIKISEMSSAKQKSTKEVMRNMATRCRCKGAPDTDKDGAMGECFYRVLIDNTEWAVVMWDGDYAPELYETTQLLVEKPSWVPMWEVKT